MRGKFWRNLSNKERNKILDQAHSENDSINQRRDLKESLRQKHSNKPETARDQKYYEGVFGSGQKYYNEVFGGKEFKEFNRRKNNEGRIDRELRAYENQLKHENRKSAIQSVYDKSGGVYDKASIGQAYGTLSKRPDFANMSQFDRESQLLNVAEKQIVNSRVGKMSGGEYEMSEGFKEKVFQDEQKKLRAQVSNAKNANQPQASSPAGRTTSSSSGQTGSRAVDEAIEADDAFNPKNLSASGKWEYNQAMKKNQFMNDNAGRLDSEDFQKQISSVYGETVDPTKFASDNAYRQKQMDSFAQNRAMNPGMEAKMWGNKIPQMAVGGLATAGLVSAMSNSKGQQSNSQLYGQQQPYY